MSERAWSEETLHDVVATDGHHHHKNGGTPSFRAAFSVVATMAGAGILGMPSTLQQAGWIGAIILVIIWFMALYCGIILIKAMMSRPGLRTYHDIGEAAFGKFGRYLSLFLQNCSLIAVGILFLILAGTNIKNLTQHWHHNVDPFDWKYGIGIYISLVTGVVLPFVVFLKTMTEISFVAIFGMFATTFTVVIIVIFSVIDRPSPPAVHQFIDYKFIPVAFSGLVFAFGGHNLFPAIQDEMRHKHQFNGMLTGAFLIILALYLPPSIAGYWAFGINAGGQDGNILDNLHSGVVPEMARIAITLHLIITIPIVNNPINLWLEDLFNINNKPRELLWRAIIRTMLIAFQTGVAILLPYFFDVMTFIGSTSVSATVFYLPCAMYLKLLWPMIPWYEVAAICLTLLTATVGSVIGMFLACIYLYQDATGRKVTYGNDILYMVTGGVTGVATILIALGIYLIAKSHRNKSGYHPLN
eukprot:TRINITY_DN5766_c0_g1_i1.p1 TRINITY_DN5766_c0_g1~~TRINITY_DN5766_c0_g1_i1.p1  ORF type:complete len:470 (+),score=79.84 TRINITY_DN5766_c0_g1_i1:167-1576(+)